MKIALTGIFLFFSASLLAQVKHDDKEIEKLIGHLHLIENLKNKWISKLNTSFDTDPKAWEGFADPLKAKMAVMDSLYTTPDEILAKIYIPRLKELFTPKEIVAMNGFFSTEAGQKYITQLGVFKYDPYDGVIEVEAQNYFYKISGTFFAKHEEFMKQPKKN